MSSGPGAGAASELRSVAELMRREADHQTDGQFLRATAHLLNTLAQQTEQQPDRCVTDAALHTARAYLQTEARP